MEYECEVCFEEINAYEEVECDFCGKIMCKSCADYNDGYCYECAQDLRKWEDGIWSFLKKERTQEEEELWKAFWASKF